MLHSNSIVDYVMKLMEANLVYVNLDQANQQVGLKLLVSQCKTYERLLGIKYTLQTCVWYNLDGIERFFDDMCAELLAESAKHAHSRADMATHPAAGGLEKNPGGAGPVFAEYVVKTAAEFDDGNVADHEDKSSRGNYDGQTVSELSCDDCARSDEHDSEGSEAGHAHGNEDKDEGMTSVDCQSNTCNSAETSLQHREGPTCTKCWVIQAPSRSSSGQYRERNKTAGTASHCTKASMAEPEHNPVDTSLSRSRKQKHPTRKVSPLKISLKKRFSQRSETFGQDYIKVRTVQSYKDATVAGENNIRKVNDRDDCDAARSGAIAGVGETCTADAETTCTAGAGERGSRATAAGDQNMGEATGGEENSRASTVEEIDGIAETPDKADSTPETADRGDIEAGCVAGEAIILGCVPFSRACTSPTPDGALSRLADKKLQLHTSKVNRLAKKAQLMKALEINPKTSSNVKTVRKKTAQLKQLKKNSTTTLKLSKQKQLKRDRAKAKLVRTGDCSTVSPVAAGLTAAVASDVMSALVRNAGTNFDSLTYGVVQADQFECRVCRLIFQSRRALARHRTTNGHCVRAGGPQVHRHYLCQECGKAYYKKHGLQRHLRLHRGEKQQACQYCDFRCHEANNLKRHIALHFESQRNFVCEICGASFHAKKTLESHHIYKHNSERKFQCSQCFLSFKEKSALKRHEKIHNLEKEHKCVCGTAFRRICNLRRHLKLVHGGDENYLPPVKHVSTLDLRKKKSKVCKPKLTNVLPDYRRDSLYDDGREAAPEGHNSSSLAEAGYTESGKTYTVSLSKQCSEDHINSSNSMVVTDQHKILDNSNATLSDYGQHDIERNTPTEVIHKQSTHPQEQNIINHEASQQVANREMLVSNFMFPHLAMATNSFGDQPAPVLPHIHMLQNSQLKDNLQVPIPRQAPAKFTFTFGNHWQKFIPSDIDNGFKEQDATKGALGNMKECSWNDHSFRFPSTHLVNQDSSGALQGIVGHDPRSALQGIAGQDPRSALHGLLNQDARGALHGVIRQDPRGAIQELINQDPRGALQGLLNQDAREGFSGHVNHDSRGSVSGLVSQDHRETMQEEMNMGMHEEDLSQNSAHDSQSDLVAGKLVIDESSYTSPYQLGGNYSQQSSYETVVTNDKTNMSEQSDESEYFQSRREIAAESLAQLAELAMEASYQQQATASLKTRLL